MNGTPSNEMEGRGGILKEGTFHVQFAVTIMFPIPVSLGLFLLLSFIILLPSLLNPFLKSQTTHIHLYTTINRLSRNFAIGIPPLHIV